MAQMFDLVEAQAPGTLTPVFVTCDPERDGPEVLKSYLAEFHPGFVGLTGTYEQIKDMCKAYRVYFSTPPDAAPTDDYLVDHSIFFYFMDPNGQFVDAFGKVSTVSDVVERVKKEITRWEGETGRKV